MKVANCASGGLKSKFKIFKISKIWLSPNLFPGPLTHSEPVLLAQRPLSIQYSTFWVKQVKSESCLFFVGGVKVGPNPSKKQIGKHSYSSIFHTRLFLFWLKALYPPMTKPAEAIWSSVKLTIDLRYVEVFPHQQIVLLTTPSSALGLQIIPFLLWFLVQLGHAYQPGKFWKIDHFEPRKVELRP